MNVKFLRTGFLLQVFLPTFTFAQWSDSPMVNNQVSFLPGDQTQCYVATHPNGTTYISWFSSELGGNYYPRVQKYDVEGYQQWADDGILVSNHPSMTWITDYDMTVSADGGCIIAFQDTRTGNNDAFIYKLSPGGDFLWGDDGIQLSGDVHFDANPLLLATDDGGAYVVWPKMVDNGDGKVMAQRITGSGQKAWSSDISLGALGFDYAWPQVVGDGAGGIIITWYKEWGVYWAPNRDILAQRFDENGNAIWANPATLFTGSQIPVYVHQQAVPDGTGGAWVCWFYEQVSNHLSTFVQHVDNSGGVAFSTAGLEASTNMGTLHLEPAICSDPSTQDAYIFWRETNPNQSQFGLYGQRIDLAGNRLWGNNGKQFIPVGSQNPILINLSPLSPGGVVSYLYSLAIGTNYLVNAIRFDEDGNQVWSPSPVNVSSVMSEKGKLHAGEYRNGQAILAWMDQRNGNPDIYAQNISEEGLLGPLSYEVTVTPDTLFFLDPQNFTDGVPFTIANTGGNPVDVLYIQPWGEPVGPYISWYISPPIPSYPVTLNPGEELTRTVFWIVTDGYPVTLVYDTLEIYTTADSVNLIIAADSIYIIISAEERPVQGIRLYPNPFSERTTLYMQTEDPISADITIFSLQGRKVKSLFTGIMNTGMHRITWNGYDELGHAAPPGVYLLIFSTGENKILKKILKTD